LGNTSLQVEIELLQTESHDSKNVSKEYLTEFYQTFDQVKHRKFDGLIITGAPVEKLEFEQVDYWQELSDIMEWSKTNVFSVLHICWGAQAGLYYHYGVPKYLLPAKTSGLFVHHAVKKDHTILRGFDDRFIIPHSRYTEIRREDIETVRSLEVVAASDDVGVNIVSDLTGRQIFIVGHIEYDRLTLRNEYIRDVQKGIAPSVPKNYFPEDDPDREPVHHWRAHANLFYSNWLNYYVYQETPYDLSKLATP